MSNKFVNIVYIHADGIHRTERPGVFKTTVPLFWALCYCSEPLEAYTLNKNQQKAFLDFPTLIVEHNVRTNQKLVFIPPFIEAKVDVQNQDVHIEFSYCNQSEDNPLLMTGLPVDSLVKCGELDDKTKSYVRPFTSIQNSPSDIVSAKFPMGLMNEAFENKLNELPDLLREESVITIPTAYQPLLFGVTSVEYNEGTNIFTLTLRDLRGGALEVLELKQNRDIAVSSGLVPRRYGEEGPYTFFMSQSHPSFHYVKRIFQKTALCLVAKCLYDPLTSEPTITEFVIEHKKVIRTNPLFIRQ